MKFAEFFAGVGLVREGLTDDAWECVWANDICPSKKETYTANFGDSHFVLGDVWQFATKPSSIPDDTFLYTASFPCTDLSVAGGRAGLAGAHSGSLNAVMKILLEKRKTDSAPKVVLLENVSGFLTSHQGKDVSDTVRLFSELDYVVDIIELDASFFTPQSRKRVFVIAVDRSVASDVMLVKDKELDILDSWWSEFDESSKIRSTKLRNIILANPEANWGLFKVKDVPECKDRLDSIIDVQLPESSERWWSEEKKNKIFSQMSDGHKQTLKEMSESNVFSYGTVYRRMRYGRSMAELRTDGIAGCLRTPRGGSSKQIVIRAGKASWKVRLLTPREYARLQGVRDDYILPANDNKAYFAMGDAVCVPVIRYISEQILVPIYQKCSDMGSLKAG